MVKVDTQYAATISVNYADSCKVNKETPVLVKYGFLQDAATVEISSEGSQKAMEYVNIAALEKQEKIYDSGAVVEPGKSFDDLIDTALNGGILSKDEQEHLNGEMSKRIVAHYSEMQNLRLADNDKRVLEALKKNYLMKQQALKDMKQAVEDEQQQEETSQQEAEATQNASEMANKAAEADMITKSLEGLYQETATRVQENEEASMGNMSGMTGNNVVSDTDKAVNHQKVLNYDGNNKGNIEELDNQRIAEAMQEKEYSRMLDESYGRTIQVFENKEFSIKERAEAYKSFISDAEELAINRELAKHQKIYDYESVIDLRIRALSNRGMKSAKAQTDIDNIQNIGRDFVKDAIADKLNVAKKRREKTEQISDTRAFTDDKENIKDLEKKVNGD